MVVKRTNRPINLQNNLLNFSYFVYLILNTYNNKLDSEIGQRLHFVVFVSDVLTRRVLVTQEGRFIFFGIVIFLTRTTQIMRQMKSSISVRIFYEQIAICYKHIIIIITY